MDDFMKRFKIADEVSSGRESGILYYVENCKKCNNAQYFRQTSYKKDGIKLKTRGVCVNCGYRRKETLYCYDYGELEKYFTTDIEFENWIIAPHEAEVAYQNAICKRIYKIMSENGNYIKFCRDWLSGLCTYNNTYLKPFYMGILKVKNDYEFASVFSHNFFYLWD